MTPGPNQGCLSSGDRLSTVRRACQMTGGILPAQSAVPLKGLTSHYGEGLGCFSEVSLQSLGLEREGKRVFIEHKMCQVLCHQYGVHHHITSECRNMHL